MKYIFILLTKKNKQKILNQLMKIILSNIKYYYLTCNNSVRREHIQNEFKGTDITEINNENTENISKYQSGAYGFCRMLDIASRNQDPTKPFQPFILLEDDAKKMREIPESIEVPDNIDILYIGISKWGIMKGGEANQYKICYDQVNGYDQIIRIYNMLASHGIMICSVAGLIAIQKAMMEAYFTNIPWDVFTSKIQPYYNVYALKNPFVYQYYIVGGNESETCFNIKDDTNIPMNIEWIDRTNISNITASTFL